MEWGVVYYREANGQVRAEAFLDTCPTKVEATLLAVLEAVRAAPPPACSGGGKWEAMHGAMAGDSEIRVTGPGRRHYRLFWLLDNGTEQEPTDRGFDRPQIAVINGMVKQHMTEFSDSDDQRHHVRDLGERYLTTLPRPIAVDAP